MVAGGHMVDAPSFLTYASVVSRETVRIALTIVALHDLDVKAADVENPNLTAPTTEKVWTICGRLESLQSKHHNTPEERTGSKSKEMNCTRCSFLYFLRSEIKLP
jgi:hypothetical protein